MNLHDQILLYLYEHKNEPNEVDVVPVFHEVEYSILSKWCVELKKSGYIEFMTSFGGASFITDRGTSSMPASGDLICSIKVKGIEYVESKFGSIHKEILQGIRGSLEPVDLIPLLRHRTYDQIFDACTDLDGRGFIELYTGSPGVFTSRWDGVTKAGGGSFDTIHAKILLAGIDYLEGRDIKNQTFMADQINTGTVNGDMNQDNSTRINEKKKKNWFLRFWKYLALLALAIAALVVKLYS